jgi:hypothetical protein
MKNKGLNPPILFIPFFSMEKEPSGNRKIQTTCSFEFIQMLCYKSMPIK